MIKFLEKLETELKLRGFSKKTIDSYIFHNEKFLAFTRSRPGSGFQTSLLDGKNEREPEDVTKDDIKAYLGFLISERSQSPASVNLALSALRFFYEGILKRAIFDGIKAPKLEKKLPVVLTKEEIAKMIEVTKNQKHKLLIELIYSSGLRVSEAISLKVEDLELKEGMGIIRGGKGKKDRNIILSKVLIEHLEDYLSNRKHDCPFIFNVRDRPITVRQAQKVVKNAANKAEIKKNVFCHALRSSFATHLLESGTDIRLIQELLGHSSISTTERYTKVSTNQLKKIKSPFDSFK
ncbi:tyrosine-type recombinase/integrase [Candidatus Woesearchaeota archaeon]|nr:tyrosine-type recombinase/integrase [Candidatus Woesearchaeota archaeon]